MREEHDDNGDVGDKLAGLKGSVPPSAPPPLHVALSKHRPTSACGKKMTKSLSEL